MQRRHLNLTDDFLADTLQGRTARVEEELMQHSIRAVDQLGVDPQEIGTVVTASLYSLGCPTLAHRLVDHYEMDPATDKYHITGVGCASAVPLLRLASQTLPQHPGKHSLVVAAESMSSLLMRATPEDPRAKTVGSAIFGDGCGAALLSAARDAEGPTILASQVHQISDTLGAVSLALSPEDSYLHLARELPDLAAAGLGELVAGFLHRNRLARSGIDHWIVHPGGRRIVESVQDVLELSHEDVAVSWEALAEHGNVGTPSIMYVLKDTIEQAPAPRGRARPDGHDRPRRERRPDAAAVLSSSPDARPSARTFLKIGCGAAMRTAAILPVKRFSNAKQRLGASVADPLRLDLVRAMVGDVLSALHRCATIDLTIVVTNEESVAAAARYQGAIVVADSAEAGQSAAVALGISRARAESAERVLCIPGDCPALDPAELDELLGTSRAGGAAEGEAAVSGGTVVVVPDRHGSGTNGLLIAPPGAISPSFGPGSCERHRELARAAGASCRLERPASLLLDIDTGEDLAVLRERLAGEREHAPRTRAVLGLRVTPSQAA